MIVSGPWASMKKRTSQVRQCLARSMTALTLKTWRGGGTIRIRAADDAAFVRFQRSGGILITILNGLGIYLR